MAVSNKVIFDFGYMLKFILKRKLRQYLELMIFIVDVVACNTDNFAVVHFFKLEHSP